MGDDEAEGWKSTEEFRNAKEIKQGEKTRYEDTGKGFLSLTLSASQSAEFRSSLCQSFRMKNVELGRAVRERERQ